MAIVANDQLTVPAAEDDSEVEFARAIFSEFSCAIRALSESVDTGFAEAVRLLSEAPGHVVVGGLGKSGHVARKLAATLSSTGTPAFFLHLSEASHGDLGTVRPGDCAILLSHSGRTPELLPVIDHFKHLGGAIIGISSAAQSPLIAASDAAIILPPWDEVCPHGLAPTTSTLMSLAVGDALAMAVMRRRGFGRVDFHRLHPAGALGARLKPVSSVMRRGVSLPLVRPDTLMLETVVEMTEKRLGVVGVVDADHILLGIITDGDLRRHLDELPHATAAEVMTSDPKVVRPITLAEDALEMMNQLKITALFVVEDPADPRPVGLVHIHDFPPA